MFFRILCTSAYLAGIIACSSTQSISIRTNAPNATVSVYEFDERWKPRLRRPMGPISVPADVELHYRSDELRDDFAVILGSGLGAILAGGLLVGMGGEHGSHGNPNDETLFMVGAGFLATGVVTALVGAGGLLSHSGQPRKFRVVKVEAPHRVTLMKPLELPVAERILTFNLPPKPAVHSSPFRDPK